MVGWKIRAFTFYYYLILFIASLVYTETERRTRVGAFIRAWKKFKFWKRLKKKNLLYVLYPKYQIR